MKFGENLQYYATAEWRDKYIDYEKLKTLLEDAQTTHTDTWLGDDEKEKPKNTQPTTGDEVFFREIAEQLEKVNHFYNERYSKVVQTFNGLKKDVEFYKNVIYLAIRGISSNLLSRKKKILDNLAELSDGANLSAQSLKNIP